MAILFVYSIMSVIAFCVYGLDKFKAQKGTWRVPEKTLHVLELCCGWPGAMAAHKVLRHKSFKSSFRRVFWVMTVLNVVIVGLLLTIR